MPKFSKYKQILADLHIINNVNDNDIIDNLMKKPHRDNKTNTPSTNVPTANYINQADLLYLPNDDGFKYALVVVDLATSTIDSEPLKNRLATTTRDALIKIYKRGILKQPKVLEVDNGSEFKSEFALYFNKHLTIRYKVPHRHRQQSTVETYNGILGKLIFRRQLAQEINNKETSREWVDDLPLFVKAINHQFIHSPHVIDGDIPPRCDGSSCDLLLIGTPVRIQLDMPKDVIDGKLLHGTFRKTDIRWEKTVKHITNFYLDPGQVPMYCVDNNINVAYTKNQLQVVPLNEITPPKAVNRKFIVKEILQKLKIKNKIYYKVLWSDNSTTNEPRTNLIKDIPDLVNAFEISLNTKTKTKTKTKSKKKK